VRNVLGFVEYECEFNIAWSAMITGVSHHAPRAIAAHHAVRSVRIVKVCYDARAVNPTKDEHTLNGSSISARVLRDE
jgi:hypothetical protein